MISLVAIGNNNTECLHWTCSPSLLCVFFFIIPDNNVNINNGNRTCEIASKVQCSNKCSAPRFPGSSALSGRPAGVPPRIHDTVLLYSVRRHMKKHTHAPVQRPPRASPPFPRRPALTDATPKRFCPKWKSIPWRHFFFHFLHLNTSPSRQLFFFFITSFSPQLFLASSTFRNTLEFGLWMVMCPSGFTPLLCRFSGPLAGFGALTASSFGQVDDRNPLIHAAALSAEPVHFAQSGILPRRRMWALKKTHRQKNPSFLCTPLSSCSMTPHYCLHANKRYSALHSRGVMEGRSCMRVY